jgi:endonuclease-3
MVSIQRRFDRKSFRLKELALPLVEPTRKKPPARKPASSPAKLKPGGASGRKRPRPAAPKRFPSTRKVIFPKPEGGKALKLRVARINRKLGKLYGHMGTALHFDSPFQLIVATVLSAQSTDEQVNRVTPALFRKYPTPHALGAAPVADVEKLVHSTGFYRQKTKSIQSLARDLVERFGGEVPVELDDLISLRGVGRKTANCVRSQAFGLPGVIVDTHFKRLAQRMALVDTDDPDRIEAQICELLPESQWTSISNAFIWHGRKTCLARNPDCAHCAVLKDCPTGRERLTD